jgi:regulator of replication initiation timing
MRDFRLYQRVETLETVVDKLHKEMHNMRQQQADMIEQIRRLKELHNDGSGK